jgi:hypothetical protein
MGVNSKTLVSIGSGGRPAAYRIYKYAIDPLVGIAIEKSYYQGEAPIHCPVGDVPGSDKGLLRVMKMT